MAVELLAVDKVVLQAITQDPTVQSLLGFLGSGNPGNNPRFPSSAVDATAAVFADEAPQGTPTPVIVFSTRGTDVNTVGGFRAFEPSMLNVYVAAPGGGYGGVKPLADAVDAVVEAIEPFYDSVDNVQVYRFVRCSTIKMSYNINNVTWYHLGGVYDTITS